MHRLSLEELLDLSLNNQLSPEQRQELSERINQDQDPEHATAWFYRLWDEMHFEKADKRSGEVFAQLKQKLELKDDRFRFMQPMLSGTQDGRAGFKMLIRYAAVFVMAFGLAWLIFYRGQVPSSLNSSKANVISVPNGSKSYLTLEDGTEIWLNSGSRLTCNNFSNASVREVYLEGEAFFDVRKDRQRPFVVKTSDLKVKVLGTRFNIKSYPTEKITETVLVTGKLQIEEINAMTAGEKIITLEPNQKATYFSESRVLELEKSQPEATSDLKVPAMHQIIENVNPELYTSWKDEKLIFTNERLESLVIKMERWFNVDITLKDSLLKDFRYTGKFEKENIEQALKALKLATPLEYQIDKDKITLYLAEIKEGRSKKED
jgi:transmembrane sensor